MKLRFLTSVFVIVPLVSSCSRFSIDQRASLKDGDVTVSVEPPSTEIKYLDGIYWPQGKACGRAYTYWTFMCRPEFRLKPLPELSKPGIYVYEITAVSMKLALPLRTWLPFGVKDKLKAHEVGHLKMCEAIYKDADKIARECAGEMIGRHIQSSARDENSALEGAYTEAKRTLDANYHKKIEGFANETGVIYDRITNHGMNEVPEEQAMKESFAEYAKSKAASERAASDKSSAGARGTTTKE